MEFQLVQRSSASTTRTLEVNHVATLNQSDIGSGVGIYAEGGSSNPLVTFEDSSAHDYDGMGIVRVTAGSSFQKGTAIRRFRLSLRQGRIGHQDGSGLDLPPDSRDYLVKTEIRLGSYSKSTSPSR